MPKKKKFSRTAAKRFLTKAFGKVTGYCVYTSPSGQPGRKVRCFRTKKAALRFAHRDSSWQIIPQRSK